ncbi:MAG: lactonase family protein [Gemmataceae bacterium]
MRMRSWGVAAMAVMTALASAPAEEAKPGKVLVYVGTYTAGTKSQGVYRMELDLASGALSTPTLAGKTTNPSFLALHPSGKYLYAVGEVWSARGGTVTAFAIDAAGDLTPLNQQSSEGAGPCHVTVNKDGTYAFCANYGSGSAAALPIAANGRLGKATGVVQHKGSSVNKSRQEGPHAHSINLDPTGRFAFVADLGLDKVMIYRFDPAKGTLTANDPPFVAVKPGAGPRHFAFHPSGKFAYVINELDSTVTAFRYDAAAGALEAIDSVSTLPKGYKGNTSTAEVVVHPSGQFVYGSNRGQNSIAVFTVDAETGKLTPAGRQGKDVKVPRNFAIDPTGSFCLVANQDGHSVVVFRIDAKTGALTPTGHQARIDAPVCVRFLSRGAK